MAEGGAPNLDAPNLDAPNIDAPNMLHPEPIVASLQEAIATLGLQDQSQIDLAASIVNQVATIATVRVRSLQETIEGMQRQVVAGAREAGAAGRRPRDDGANLERQIDRFWKQAPLFYLGKETWGTFMQDFKISSENVPDEDAKKKLLFKCLRGEAKVLASNELYPQLPANTRLTFAEYQRKMNELFEPSSESENAKLEFSERQQLVGERPTTYFTVKQNLFDRAWPKALQDMQFFFDETTKGLLNETIKSTMWTMELHTTQQYKEKLQFLAGMVQKRYRAKEIAQSETIGAETFTVRQQVNTRDEYAIKMEPGVNALSEEDKVCFYCRKKGHFVRNCPRKLAGLTPPAAAIEEGLDQEEEEEEEADGQEVHYMRTGRNMRGRVPVFRRNNRFNRGSPYKKPFVKNDKKQVRFNDLNRIGLLYTDQDGKQYIQDEDDDSENAEEEQENEGVNTILLDEQQDKEDYSEADFIPHPFLGMNSIQQ